MSKKTYLDSYINQGSLKDNRIIDDTSRYGLAPKTEELRERLGQEAIRTA